MEELAKRLEDNDPAEAYYWYRLSVKRLNPADVGASRVDMEKWSIGKLKQILPQEIITAEDDLIEQFSPKQ